MIDDANLPTYHSVKDRATARQMLDIAGGASPLKTVYRTNADGTVSMLRTRNGFPEITTSEKPTAAPLPSLKRGFVAHVYSAQIAALFSPYSLTVENDAYPLFDAAYTVLPFRTTYNVPDGDTTLWFDVLSVKNGVVRVNAKAMSPLKVSAGTVRSESVPFLISASDEDTVDGRYGTGVENTTVKRVFMVGRYEVNYWGTTPLDVVLSGATARSELRAMTNGMAVNPVDNSAWMSQLSYTGSSWDDPNGGWAFSMTNVGMSTTSPYLAKTDSSLAVDQPSCSLSLQGRTTGSVTSSTTLPDTEIGCIGHAAVSFQANGVVNIQWRADEKLKKPLAGTETYTYTDSTYVGDVSLSDSVVGLPVTVTATNTKTVSSRRENKNWITQTIDLPPDGYTSGQSKLSVDSTSHDGSASFVWPTPGISETDIGSTQFYVLGGVLQGYAYYTATDQSGEFSISVDGVSLVRGEFSKKTEHGDAVTANPTDTRTDPFFGQSMETLSIQSDAYANSEATINSRWDELNGMLLAKAGEWAGGCIAYGKLLSGTAGGFYTVTIDPRQDVDDRSISWQTKDFILYDDDNSVYISVEASFSALQSYGSPGSGTLTITLKTSTPAGTTVSPLFTADVGYNELLPDVEQGNIMGVPIPKLRVLFTPLHRGQGAFDGAVYTTAKEVASGATPAYLFDFTLSLKTYSSIGYADGNPVTHPVVEFIPCNLLEMLYAYVFSTKYGLDEYERYPVENTTLFNAMQETLFNVQTRICYRDGELVDWLDDLGGEYVTAQTTELSRT